ncbi:hypothetical protein INQ71_26170, partial [Escherichia coli]|uniref:hypothetical protein n=1 Tax=Escherichia coli TaxID=562 RepID=UPI001E5366E6
LHIGNDNKQQIVAFAHGFRDGLDSTLLRFFLQALTDFRRVGEVTLINDAAQELLNYRKSQDDEKLSTLSHSWSQVVDVSEVL